MSDLHRVTQGRLTAASDADMQRGFLGRVHLVLNGLVVEGVALRRALDGRLTLIYPTRREADGGRHVVICPIDDHVRLAIEVEVFPALGVKPKEMPS